MKIFDNTSDARRVVCYDKFDLDVMERHLAWCNKKPAEEKNIYLIFLLREAEDIKLYRSNRLNNKFCIMYAFPIHTTNEWLQHCCRVCFSEEDMQEKRMLFLKKEEDQISSSSE